VEKSFQGSRSHNPKLSSQVWIEDVEAPGEKRMFLLLDPAIPSWVIINQDAMSILEHCDGRRSVEDIAQIVSNRYEIDFSTALKQTESFIREMEAKLILNAPLPENPPDKKFRGIALEITKRCNLRCKHCYLDAGSHGADELDTSNIKDIITMSKDEGGISVALGGGEPLLHPDWRKIVNHALACDLLVSLGTNASLIQEDTAKIMADLPIKIQISLDGATEATHDAIRGKGSFKATMKGLEFLLANGKGADIVLAFTPMKLNIHEVSDFIRLAHKLGISVVQFPPLTPSGRARKNWEALQPSNGEMYNFWKTIYTYTQNFQGEMTLLADCFSMDIRRRGMPYQCSIGTQLRIDPFGNVYPCQCFHFGTDFLLGNLKKTNLKSIIEGEKLKKRKRLSLSRTKKIQGCTSCRWRHFCGAGCMGYAYETTGTPFEAPTCELRKAWIEFLFAEVITRKSQELSLAITV